MAIAPKVWSYLPYHVVCFIPHILCVLDTFYTMPDKGVCPSKKGHGFVGKGVWLDLQQELHRNFAAIISVN